MSAESDDEAASRFADQVRRAGFSVTREPARLTRPHAAGLYTLALGTPPAPVHMRGRRDLFLAFSQRYDVLEPSRPGQGRSIRVHAYWYYVYEDPQGAREILAYHWHPDAPIKHPHLHPGPAMMSGLDWLRGLHLPTGEVTIGDFLALLITDFGVRPLRADWEALLEPVRHAT